MKTGRNLAELADEIMVQARSKKDYAMDTRNLTMLPDANLRFALGGDERVVRPTKICVDQIGARVGIPSKYMERMRTEAPALLAANVNHWFQKTPDVRMLRTIQNGDRVARAFLSNRYRPLDNYDLVNNVLPQMQAAGMEIRSAELTETRLYIQAVTPKLTAAVKVGDEVQAGVVLRNSEVGFGSIAVEPLIWVLACKNGAIMSTALKRHHVGRAGEGDWESGDAFEVFSDETRKLDDRAFWAKVNDVVASSVNEVTFRKNVKLLSDASKVDTGRPQEAVEIVGARFDLSEDEQKNVLTHLAKGGDLSLWGLSNAVTRTAEDCPSYDRAIDLERFGGQVVELPADMFKTN